MQPNPNMVQALRLFFLLTIDKLEGWSFLRESFKKENERNRKPSMWNSQKVSSLLTSQYTGSYCNGFDLRNQNVQHIFTFYGKDKDLTPIWKRIMCSWSFFSPSISRKRKMLTEIWSERNFITFGQVVPSWWILFYFFYYARKLFMWAWRSILIRKKNHAKNTFYTKRQCILSVYANPACTSLYYKIYFK